MPTTHEPMQDANGRAYGILTRRSETDLLMRVGFFLLVGVGLPFAVLAAVYALGRFGLWNQASIRNSIICQWVFAGTYLVFGLIQALLDGFSLNVGLWVFIGIGWAACAIGQSRRHKLMLGKDRRSIQGNGKA